MLLQNREIAPKLVCISTKEDLWVSSRRKLCKRIPSSKLNFVIGVDDKVTSINFVKAQD